MKRGDGLEAIEPFIGTVLESVEPRQRRRLIDKLMRMVRRANAQRITANVEPQGGKMTTRKKRPEGKRGKMFRRIGKTSSLRIRITADSGELRFATPLIEATAAEHHHGMQGFVGKTRDGKVIRTKYDARHLLGFGKEQDELMDEVLRHLR